MDALKGMIQLRLGVVYILMQMGIRCNHRCNWCNHLLVLWLLKSVLRGRRSYSIYVYGRACKLMEYIMSHHGKGELAIAFGELLRKLWSYGSGVVPPYAFKGKFTRFAPQLSGYNQRASQLCQSVEGILLPTLQLYSIKRPTSLLASNKPSQTEVCQFCNYG